MGDWIGVETNVGKALLARWALGGHVLTISGATVGSGTVQQANMRTREALVTEKMDADIIEKVEITDGVKVRVRVGPASSEVGSFTAHEIGVWAHLDSEDDILLSYHMDDETGIPVPTAATSHEFLFDLICVYGISNDGTLTVTISTSVYVSNGQFVEEQKRMRLLAEDMPECTATPTFDANGNITTLTHVYTANGLTARTDEYTRGETTITEVRTLDSGETLTITTNLTTKAQTLAFG
jgi:hypothetical protein